MVSDLTTFVQTYLLPLGWKLIESLPYGSSADGRSI
jgi:hypothetical protein